MIFVAAVISIASCFAFNGCKNDIEKETIKYGKEYVYSFQYETKATFENGVIISSPQGNILINHTITKSYIFYKDGTYIFEDEEKEDSVIRNFRSDKFGYGTYQILSDNYLYLTQYSYDDEIMPLPITFRFEVKDEKTLIYKNDEAEIVYTIKN